MADKELTPQEALYFLYTHEDLKNRDVVAYLLEEEYLEQYYNIVKKELKAFNIVKEKMVDTFMIIFHPEYDVSTYNELIQPKWRQLTKEEFDDLKETLL